MVASRDAVEAHQAQVQERILSDKSDESRWHKNIAEIQVGLTALEGFPALYHANLDLLKAADQEALLNTLLGYLSEATKKVEEQLLRNEKPDFNEIKRIVDDMLADKFGEIEDFGQHAMRKLNEELKNKFIVKCQQLAIEADKMRKQIMARHRIATDRVE
jgi:hypothetical protein